MGKRLALTQVAFPDELEMAQFVTGDVIGQRSNTDIFSIGYAAAQQGRGIQTFEERDG